MHAQRNTHTWYRMSSTGAHWNISGNLSICLEHGVAHLDVHLMTHSNLDSTSTHIVPRQSFGLWWYWYMAGRKWTTWARVSSAAEAELGVLFINAKEAVYIRNILEEMGHPQPPTPIQTDNSIANGVVNNIIQPKQMKAMDRRFHWLRDRMNQGQFRFHWRPGPTNLADYWTKFHTAAHHKNFRREFLTLFKLVEKLFRSEDNLLWMCAKPYGAS